MTAQRFASDLGIFGTPGDVSPWQIRFDADDVAHFEADAAGLLRVRLWAEPRLDDATMVVRLGRSSVEAHPMRRVGSGGDADLWELEEVVEGPFDWSFAFRSPRGRPVYLSPFGITNAIERLDRWHHDGSPRSGPRPAAWAQGAVFYQIFPDRFANGDPSLDPPGARPWDAEPTASGFQGGDLPGITARLDHLTGLGVDAIYLNPIFSSPSNHRYDTTDYYEVDHHLGGNDALGALVAAAHERDVRIVLDASFNHVHPTFFAFRDLMERGPKSEYAGWFRFDDWPLQVGYRPAMLAAAGRLDRFLEHWEAAAGPDLVELEGEGATFEPGYETWYGVPTMARVDLSDPGARRYMLDVARHWVVEYDVDGWRMDVTRYVDADFWDDFGRVVREAKPGAHLIAEVFGDASDWLQGGRFDATMNYTFRELAVQFLAEGAIDGHELLAGLTRLWGMYSRDVSLANYNLLGSHDVPRFLTKAGRDLDSLRLATALQMLFPGAPAIYYGDEAGLTGGEDPGPRATMPWGLDLRAEPAYRDIASLASLRRERAGLRAGGFEPLEATEDAILFARSGSGGRPIVAINRGRASVTFDVPVSRILWGEGTTERGLTVQARGAVVAL